MRAVSRPFLYTVVSLVFVGFLIFSSAAFGLAARDGASFSFVVLRQMLFGVVLGSGLAFITSKISYKFWGKYALYIFIASILLTLLVWVPGLGFEHSGARRWISIGSLTFQPAEFLKFGFVVYFASWIASVRTKITTFKLGTLPLIVLMAIVGGLLLIQPDTGTFLVVGAVGLSMYMVGGARWKHILLLILIGIILLSGLILARPYLLERLKTYVNPARDPLGAGYQIQQSLIAIGSGGVFGRGLGQSVQKFSYLPEPMGDSIFAVYAEEWGIVGSLILIALITTFLVLGLKIAARAPTIFSSLLVTGLVLLITIQSYFNIASMLGILPLTGMPLIFVSQGGTALMFALAEVGIILNVSRHTKKNY